MGVMQFVWIAGLELDLKKVWVYRREILVTAGLVRGTRLAFGCAAAVGMLMFDGWIGAKSNELALRFPGAVMGSE